MCVVLGEGSILPSLLIEIIIFYLALDILQASGKQKGADGVGVKGMRNRVILGSFWGGQMQQTPESDKYRRYSNAFENNGGHPPSNPNLNTNNLRSQNPVLCPLSGPASNIIINYKSTMQIDLSLLQDFKIEDKQWIDWTFTHEQYQHIPLSFFNRFNKAQIKCCNLASAPTRKDEEEFTVVEGNTKVTNKDYISKNIKMGDRRKNNVASTRTFTKKQRRGLRTWHNQYKTKFKELTVKNDWTNVKTINKRDLSEHVPKIKSMKVETIKKVGKLHRLNEKVEKISWNPVGFKENEEYKVKSVSTLGDPVLAEIATDLMNSEEPIRKSVVCSIEFLLAILTVRGGQYPWNIHIEKEGNLILLENFKKSDEGEELSYLDLFTTNENTTNNMPSDENKIKDHCYNATKYTQVFKDLLASGDVIEEEEEESEEEEKEEDEEEEEKEEEQQIDYVKKYIKIQLDDIDIYTAVRIDGVKVRNEEKTECLIRAFMETGTDSGWIEDIKKTQGTLVFQEYLSNSCSLQKWICEAVLAGVDTLKLGFIGFEKQKPKIINVTETTIKHLESFISFKEAECWPILKYVLDVLYSCENGTSTYVLARSPYTPLAIKLYNLPAKEEEEEDDE